MRRNDANGNTSYEDSCDQALLALDLFENGNVVGARSVLRGFDHRELDPEVGAFVGGLWRSTWPHWFTQTAYLLVALVGVLVFVLY
ncbi:MAG: hypothetical protein HUU55_09020 [Myxococcales bacterium]|nr:hypothetical protein [Myxococcales bacterium]